jgi:hypothetical protein
MDFAHDGLGAVRVHERGDGSSTGGDDIDLNVHRVVDFNCLLVSLGGASRIQQRFRRRRFWVELCWCWC